jgi:hypothetical protein
MKSYKAYYPLKKNKGRGLERAVLSLETHNRCLEASLLVKKIGLGYLIRSCINS